MNSWHLTCDDEADPVRWQRLPPPAMVGLSSPIGYRPLQASVDAVNVALALGQPLLVTGEPGCGKTALADWIAFKLGLGAALRFQTRSTATARDLFYNFDAVGRFHAAQTGANPDARAFISYQAMGEAVMRALGRTQIAGFVSPARLMSYDVGPRRSVVLIDEIDKASRDFPNDVLGELERFGFEIPELGVPEVSAPKEFLPIIIVTSNAERSLPDAFLRRCLYHHMEFPKDDLLKDILASRIAGVSRTSGLVKDAVKLVRELRDPRINLRKVPGTSELLAFILALRDRGYGPDDRLVGDQKWISDAITTLIKTSEAEPDARGVMQRLVASG